MGRRCRRLSQQGYGGRPCADLGRSRQYIYRQNHTAAFNLFHDLEHGYANRYELISVATMTSYHAMGIPIFAPTPLLATYDGVALARTPADPAGCHRHSVAIRAYELLRTFEIAGSIEANPTLEGLLDQSNFSTHFFGLPSRNQTWLAEKWTF